MKDRISGLISRVPETLWKQDLYRSASRYHAVALWAALIFDPVFALTDFINIRESWIQLFLIRLGVAVVAAISLFEKKKGKWPGYVYVLIVFTLISLQNAYTYSLIGNQNLLGHNLNYMALLVGASMLVLWEWKYSLGVIILSTIASIFFISGNPNLDVNAFIVQGGLLLIASGFFMTLLINTRYRLSVREIKARLALQLSNDEIQAQAEEIRAINEHLEDMVDGRTQELQSKNKTLEEYAFINAHKLRGPLASILGLMDLVSRMKFKPEDQKVIDLLQSESRRLDDVIDSIRELIEKGDAK